MNTYKVQLRTIQARAAWMADTNRSHASVAGCLPSAVAVAVSQSWSYGNRRTVTTRERLDAGARAVDRSRVFGIVMVSTGASVMPLKCNCGQGTNTPGAAQKPGRRQGNDCGIAVSRPNSTIRQISATRHLTAPTWICPSIPIWSSDNEGGGGPITSSSGTASVWLHTVHASRRPRQRL